MAGGFGAWVGLLGGLSVVVVFLTVAVVYVFSAREKASINSLTNAVESRDAEIEGLRLDVGRHERTIEANRVRHHAEVLALEAKVEAQQVVVEAQQVRIAELEAQRPSAEQLQIILTAVQTHDERVQPVIDKLLGEGAP